MRGGPLMTRPVQIGFEGMNHTFNDPETRIREQGKESLKTGIKNDPGK